MLTASSPAQSLPRLWSRAMVLTAEVRTFVLLSNCLRSLGCHVTRAAALPTAIKVLRNSPHDLLFLDLHDEGEQPEWIPRLLAENHWLSIVAVATREKIDGVVRCLRAGAQECLAKPIDGDCLRRLVIQRCASAGQDPGFQVSAASCMRLATESIRSAAQCDLPVMLRGENGTGKTMFAEALHRYSARGGKPFVTVNCPSLCDELAASELFGHRRGAFTGAVTDQLGKVEAAQGGSLFLDELGDLPLGVQARLLRFLQDRAFERLGETLTRYADVRLITATNRDLEQLIADGSFRPDLFYRLSGMEITIPPLRERRGDIPGLAHQFLQAHALSHGRMKTFAPGTTDVLAAYDWPGNVRELSNELLRAVVMTNNDVITPEDLSPRIRNSAPGAVYLGGDFTLQQIEDYHVSNVLQRHTRVGEVARKLGIERSTLLNKRRRLGMSGSRSSNANEQAG